MQEVKNTNIRILRPPIVTIMGHVDHGKTSILDYIRKTNIQQREHGGITQHIGAYQVSHKSKLITFIDTPGHAAFSQMRARGGKAADIVIIVVAADESIKQQTKEAIMHAKSSNTQIIVAINKIDKSGADIQKVKQDLANESILVEDWGGNTVCVEVSAKTGQGIPELLDAIVAVSELMELISSPQSELEAVIIEAKLDKQKGPVVSAIIKNGTISISQEVSASGIDAKIKSLMDDKGKMLKKAGPSTPLEILGFKKVPNVGDLIVEKGSDLAQLAIDEDRVEIVGKNTKKTVGVILKADTQGTLEAVKASLANLVTESVDADYSIKFIRTSTGNINDSDILLASNTKSVVVGFNIILGGSIKDLAEELGVSVKTYKTIYDLTDEIKELLEGTASKEELKIKGRGQVLKVFKLPSGDLIAGCKVVAGAFKEDSKVQIFDKNPSEITQFDTPIYTGVIKKLKKGKEDVAVIGKNTECGVLLKPQFEEIQKDYWIEVI